MAGDFNYFGRNAQGNERLERNSNGDTLKKYNATNTSWPTHTKVQNNGQNHKSQQKAYNQGQQNINDFFKNNF